MIFEITTVRNLSRYRLHMRGYGWQYGAKRKLKVQNFFENDLHTKISFEEGDKNLSDKIQNI